MTVGLRTPALWLIVVLVSLLTWPFQAYPPSFSNIDVSLAAALHMAAHHGLAFGSDVNIVFGPLGFTSVPVFFYSDTGIVALIVSGMIYGVAVALVTRAMWAAWGPILAAVAAFVIAQLAIAWSIPIDQIPAILVAVSTIGIHRARGALPVRWSAGLGLAAAFCLMSKMSSGTWAVALVVLVAALALADPQRRWRERVALAWPGPAAMVAGLLVLWLASGQALADILPYLDYSVDFVLGNVDGVALNTPGTAQQYAWAVIVTIPLGVALALDGRGLPVIARLACLAVWGLFAFVSFRHGFTRHDPGHVGMFFGPMLIAAAASLPVTSTRLVAALAIAPLMLGSWAVRSWPTDILNVSTVAVDSAEAMLSPSKLHKMQARARGRLRASYGLSDEIVKRLEGHAVHVDPHEASVAWAFPELEWHPAPVFQSFSAYTTRLDELNADFIGGTDAPRYVLRENIALDGRNPRFESPAYMLALLCAYREVATTDRWQLLERGPGRCGEPEPIAERRLRFGDRVGVPSARGEMVVARFGRFAMPASDRLRRAVFKRRTQWMSVGDGRLYRFLPGHSSSPHVLVLPDCLGWSPGLLDPSAYDEIAIGWYPLEGGEGVHGDASYEVEFERVPFKCS